MQNSRFPMFIAITQNVVNIAASLFFVFVLKMKVEGVALGTPQAQYAGLGMALSALAGLLPSTRKIPFARKPVRKPYGNEAFLPGKPDIFSARLPDCSYRLLHFHRCGMGWVLAVNALLMQLFTLFSYFMDGFALCAGEALTGKYIGAKDNQSLRLTIRQSFQVGIALSLPVHVTYGAGGNFSACSPNDTSVISASEEYIYWVLGHSAGRILSLSARWNLYRCHSYSRNACSMLAGFFQLLPTLLWIPYHVREIMHYGWLLLCTWHLRGIVQEE